MQMVVNIMFNKYKSIVIMSAFIFWNSNLNADTTKIDNIAACAGVVLGNGAIDFFMGDELSFDDAADIAYSAYLSEVLNGDYSQEDIKIADQILGGNLDKVIAAYNSETFDNELYEEIVSCYRLLSLQLLENAQIIIKNQEDWKELKNNSTETIKRFLRAG